MVVQHPRASGANILLLAAPVAVGELRARLDEDHRIILAHDLSLPAPARQGPGRSRRRGHGRPRRNARVKQPSDDLLKHRRLPAEEMRGSRHVQE